MARSRVDVEEMKELELDIESLDEEADEPLLGVPIGMSIPVPKSLGKSFKKKIDDALSFYEIEHKKWEKAFELFRMCGNEGIELDSGEKVIYHMDSNVDENIIRSNIRSVIRDTYMQNPHVEYTPAPAPNGETENKDFADTLEHFVNYLLNKRTAPGINLRPKMRRWILHAKLTNHGVVRLDFQDKDGSLEESITVIHELEKKLKKAKNRDEVEEIYQQLEVAHEELPLSSPKGGRITNVLPHRVIVDPDCTMSDLSDAWWLAEEYWLDRDYIEAKYKFTVKGEDDDEQLRYRSDPEQEAKDHGEDSSADTVESRVLQTIEGTMSDEQNQIKFKNKVKCYYIYDKLLRRIYLYSDEDWKTPLYVWEDDLKLSRFFRHFILSFADTVESIVQPGEVAYYIGFQNEINRINRKVKMLRDSAFGTLFYNSTLNKEETVKKILSHFRNPDEFTAIPVDLEEGQKIQDVMEMLLPPSAGVMELYNSTELRKAIDRSANTNEVEKGGEYKTNTTNLAIQKYNQVENQHTSLIVELIEENFEDLGWALSELLVSKYTKDDIAEILGEQWAEKFIAMSVDEFNQKFRMRVTAGSIQKPSSTFKKQEALQIAQAIGQVGQSTPVTTTTLLYRMFEQAFSNFIITQDDWNRLEQEGIANMTKGQSVNGQAPAPQQPPVRR